MQSEIISLYVIQGLHNYEGVYGAYFADTSRNKLLLVEESLYDTFQYNLNSQHKLSTFSFGNIYKDFVKLFFKNLFHKRIQVDIYTNSPQGQHLIYLNMMFTVREMYWVNYESLNQYPLVEDEERSLEEKIFITCFKIFYARALSIYSWGGYRTYGVIVKDCLLLNCETRTLEQINHNYKYILLDFDPAWFGVDIISSLNKMLDYFKHKKNIALKPHPQDDVYLKKYFDFPLLPANVPVEIYFNEEVKIIYLRSSAVKCSKNSINIFPLLNFFTKEEQKLTFDLIQNDINFFEISKFVEFAQ